MANMWRKRPRRGLYKHRRNVLTIDAGRVFVDRPIGTTKEQYSSCEWVPGAWDGMRLLIEKVGRDKVRIIKGLKEGENDFFEKYLITEWLEFHNAEQIGISHTMVHVQRLEDKWRIANLFESCLHIDDRLLVLGAFPMHIRIAKILFRPEQSEIDRQSEAVKKLVIPAKEIDRFCDIIWQKIIRVDDWKILPDVAFKLMELMREIAR